MNLAETKPGLMLHDRKPRGALGGNTEGKVAGSRAGETIGQQEGLFAGWFRKDLFLCEWNLAGRLCVIQVLKIDLTRSREGREEGFMKIFPDDL